MKNKIILALVGLAGSGKTEAMEYLVEKLKCPKVYFGDATFDEMRKNGLEINEANERKTREEIRSKYGMGAYAILSLQKIKDFYQKNSVLVESLYSWEEYLEIKKEFGDSFKVLAIYASPDTRIKRLSDRPIRPLTKEELISRDYSQIENLHQAGPIARADWTIINEGEKTDLYLELDKIIEKMNK